VKRSIGFAAAGILLLAASADAQIIFDTFGPGDTYNQSAGFAVAGPASSANNTFESAAQFVAAVSGAIQQIDFGLTMSGGGPVNVFLYGDAAGAPDNLTQILLGSVTPTEAFGSTNHSIVSLIPAGEVDVIQGTTYWLVLKPGNDTVRDTWNRSLGSSGVQDVSLDDMSWIQANTTLAAFEITAVPEPGTYMVAFLTLGVLVGRHLRRSRTQAGA
jgi:hypothetical protein